MEKFKEIEAKALAGNYSAMSELANYYIQGNVVEKNIEEGINWYEKAIKADDDFAPQTVNDIGRNLQNGDNGYEVNLSLALRCYKIAADAGNVYYAVSALNRYGESDLAIAGSAVAIVATGAADITITDGGGLHKATAYRIYRTEVGGGATGTFYPLFDVSVANVTAGFDGAAGGSVRDLNRFLPNCDQAMLVQFDNEVVEFAQLAPLMKMDLALLSPAYRLMILLYGTPFLYAPKKMVRIINIGAYKKSN